ncbi:piggyBac transposable element-derived protein 4-like isoform X2 [Colletes gigas]|uniref:piggyBac transposable element-derived protein 4-like isoform X2 n=1 Tax=Colletes gigas TaxID=935657 RepID=UPI001C9A7B1D|nr:piggyBac transposable element-derived protein 4-like isoform X2 [Colletes gigas]
MVEKKHTTEELLEILKDYHIKSDEESLFGSDDDLNSGSENELQSSDDNTASSEEEEPVHSEYLKKCLLPNANESEAQWTQNVVKREKVSFTGKSGIQIQLPPNITPIALFEHLFDRDVIMLMVLETNKYAQQYINKHHLSQHARMKTWKEVTENEMKKFIGIILLTGLIKLPKIEDYWKKDPLFFHPLFHHIQMSYNRFSLILKNWQFCDNKEATSGNKLYKVSKIMEMLLSNIQKLYIPGEEVSIDESIISHSTQLTLHQFNSVKCHRCGIKIYKLCDMSGYVWNMCVYSSLSKNKRPDLNYSGTVVVDLGEPLLNCGRLFVTDNRYSSIELASYLKARNTEFCGILKSDKRNFPESLKTIKLKRGEMKSMSNSEGIRIFKYQDKKEIFMISTFHGNKMKTMTKSKQSGETVTKPSVIVDCNRLKSSIRLSNQMIKYYSLARKSIKWYRKILFQISRKRFRLRYLGISVHRTDST